ncbi:MAG: ribosome biogenesis GTPase YlqF [Syntrophomonadaceae bacterium]|nr:ribosome biogenesis GTPase YlqF [Syntrophomonadaceae bacterium]
MEIQWYPGHMVKAKKMIRQNLGLVDVVIELVDARIPYSSRNPDMQTLLSSKPRLLVLNKDDLADPDKTQAWCAYFREQGSPAIALNSVVGRGMGQVITIASALVEDKMEIMRSRGRRDRSIRAMVVGIPNVGKSAFINSLIKRSVARVGDKPGVTRGKQWIRIGEDFELLDTPGILWPKFEDPEVGFKLAVTGAVSDLVYDLEEVGVRLIELLTRVAPEALRNRYRIGIEPVANNEVEAFNLLIEIGRRRGFLQPGNNVDTIKAAYMIIQEFREGKIGRITLDEVPATKSE